MSAKCHGCIGGRSLGDDRKALEQGVQVISGTPGRVYDLIKRGHLMPKSLKAFIIDEADEMLKMGVYVIGYSYPLVPRGQARIRAQIAADHTEEQIERALAAFTDAGRKVGLIKKVGVLKN